MATGVQNRAWGARVSWLEAAAVARWLLMRLTRDSLLRRASPMGGFSGAVAIGSGRPAS